MRRCSPSYVAWATSAALILVGALSTPVLAQDSELPHFDLDVPCAPEVTANRDAAVAHEGQAGIWFHLEVMRCMTARLRALPVYVNRIGILDQELTIAGERDALRVQEVALAVQQAEVAAGALEAAVRRAREAEEDRDAWYRHPALWFVMGAVVVVVLEVVAIWGFSQVNP